MSCSCRGGQPHHPNPCGTACQQDCGILPRENPPGLTSLAYGEGWYGAVLDRMRARLSGDDLPALTALTARATDGSLDPAMALLDGWACLSEILSFYNERAVNESYLRTCTQRPSAVELARLVGYAPRPGIAADAWLAFTLDDLDRDAHLQIPTGTRAYSQPAPGETMQPFETVEPLTGRPRWSHMRPRLTLPQWLVHQEPADVPAEAPDPQDVTADDLCLYFKGIATGLAPGHVLLFDFDEEHKYVRATATVEPLPAAIGSGTEPIAEDRTRVLLQPHRQLKATDVGPGSITSEVLKELLASPGNYTQSREDLSLNPAEVFGGDSYAPIAVLGVAYPQLRGTLAEAIGGTTPKGPTGTVTVNAMRVKTSIHGHNAPLIPKTDGKGQVTSYEEWNIQGNNAPLISEDDQTTSAESHTGRNTDRTGAAAPPEETDDTKPPATDLASQPKDQVPEPRVSKEIALDAVYDGILPGSQVAIFIPTNAEDKKEGEKVPPLELGQARIFKVLEVRTESRTAFNVPARITVLTLNKGWRTSDNFSVLRNTVVYAQSEALELADRPIRRPLAGQQIVLYGYYPGLQPGRRLIFTGEREDLHGVTGVTSSELVIVSAVSHRALPDSAWSTRDTIHTYLTLASPGLRYEYRRNTVTIYGNVAHATHGESRAEVLGSGDASRVLQEFGLKQVPLTYVMAPTPIGIASTLDVRVNDLRWREARNAAAVGPEDRSYILKTGDDARSAVITGLGARLPTGRENVRATYRSGIGRVGNVQPAQISVLASQPTGVTGVTNPMATDGGTDRDDLAHIRVRAPIGLSALDRVVSAADFEDFTRNFGGIGKAKVWRPDASSQPVPPADPAAVGLMLTIAGEDDVPIGIDSTLVRNLSAALALAGDLEKNAGVLKTRNQPSLTITIQIRKAHLIALRARVRLEPDYVWEAVLPRIRAALLERLGFDARDIGQDLDPGVAIAAIQKTRGIMAVDLQKFGTIDIDFPDTLPGSTPPLPPLTNIAEQALAAVGEPDMSEIPPVTPVADDTIAYLAPDATGTLLLTPWERD